MGSTRISFDLARLYHVETKALDQAVKRNIKRFEGEDFMFQLSKEEWNIIRAQVKSVYSFGNEGDTVLRSQFVTAKSVQKQRFQPYAFVYPVPPHRFHSPKRGKQVSGTRRNIELCQYHDARKFVAKNIFFTAKASNLSAGSVLCLSFIK